MDVSGWLRRLGLGQYEAVFRENEIDGEVLPNLTAEDLKELGVAIVGHRRRILAAIAGLSALPATITKPPAAPPPAQDTAERRQLTVMFCDLVGSTAMAARMDPEDLRDVIGAYHRCVAKTVTRFGGFVAKYMGDGVLIYFGYPQAHEDDAERAILAGLKLVKKVAALIPSVQGALQLRAGISTGLVVVGDLIGSGGATEQAVVGETPNLAARLQSLAEPNTVVIADSTHRLVASLFDNRDLGVATLKGYVEPVQTWEVIRTSNVASRFEAMRSGSLTPLVGREEEIELLLRRWEQAKTGEGRVVALSGEPGVGKSRITRVLLERLAGEQPHTRLLYFCSPHHQASPLHPFIDQLERAAGFERDHAVDLKLDKLEALLAPALPPQEDVALLAELLSLSPANRNRSLDDLTPQRKKDKTFGAWLRQLEGLARQQPVLMVFEDIHWMDPTSCELLDLAVERVRQLRALLLVTFRPEYQPPWPGEPHLTMVTLSRLGPREGAELVERVVGNTAALPAGIVDKIVERADGVPLFVEELTKAVLEARGANDRGRPGALTASSPALAVPATLQASLMARLDRIPPPKELAQIGAVFGREFSHTLLTAVAGLPEPALLHGLQQLVEAGLASRRGRPPEASYTFKHAWFATPPMACCSGARRRELHARAAAALEDQSPSLREQQPELLAHHYTQAGLIEPAIAYWAKAGHRSVARSAMIEAAAQLRQALELLRIA